MSKGLNAYAHGEPDEWEIYGAAKRLWEMEDDIAVALYALALLDVALTRNLLARFWVKNKAAKDELLQGDGPLGTLSRKIRLGEAMRLYGPTTRKNLDTIREIRNAFAHTPRWITFETPAVAVLRSNLDNEVWPYKPRRPYFEGAPTPKQRFSLCAMGLWMVMRARANQTKAGETSYDGNAPVHSWWGEKYPAPLP